MTTRICTLMWGDAWQRYGRAFAESFARYWPTEVDLVLVTDSLRPLPRGRQMLLGDLPAWNAFRGRWADDRRAQGFGCTHAKRDRDGRCWRCNALKWAPQGLVPHECLDGLEDGDILVWFDADVETTAPVPDGWVETLLDGRHVACLQRPGTHSEIGFYAMRLRPATRRVLRRFADCYREGGFMRLPESHSAFVFDRALGTEPGIKVRNLNRSPHRGNAHVWPASQLAEFTVHKKGKRKDAA